MTKHSIRQTTVAALIAAVSLTALAGSAQASKRSFCKNYAKRAVSQFYEAKREGCGFSGAYWHPFKGAHRAWCMGVSRDVARRGDVHRINMLNRCEGIEEGD